MRARKFTGLAMVGPALLLGGCSSMTVPAELAAQVVASPPVGFHLGPSAVNGRYSVDKIAHASPTATTSLRRLRTAGVHGGYGHVFTRGTTFAVLILMRAKSAAAATALASGQVDDTNTLYGTAGWQPVVVPHAFGYLYNGLLNGGVQFCQGAWVAHSSDVFHVYTCDPAPGTVSLLEELMRAQYATLDRADS